MRDNARMRRSVTLCLPLILFALVCRATAAPDWNVRVAPFNQVFPALELSQARRADAAPVAAHVLGTGSGLIEVRVRARRAGERVLVRIGLPGFGAPQRFAATLAQAGSTYKLHPPLAWDVARLHALTAPLATHLNVALERDGVAVGAREIEVSLRPLNEALYFVRDGSDSVDLAWIFAAYVDENAAVVQRILDAARATRPVQSFDGYASADPDAVMRQVWAIWQVLSAHGITYSGADPAIERGPRVYTQRVRLLADTWADRTANCIDGSVLIASVLQRIGIRSFLVLVPGHAFVGFYTDADAQHATYLETTLLGAHVTAPTRLPAFARGITVTPENRASLAGFSAALAAGQARYRRAASRLDGRHRPDYAVIGISAARALGIRPIAAGK